MSPVRRNPRLPDRQETLVYLRLTGRPADRGVALVERYAASKACGASRRHRPSSTRC